MDDRGGTTPVLQVSHVGVRFGGLSALDDVNLETFPGEIVGLIGPNGAGKTTLFNVVCGFVRPDDGAVAISGRNLTRIRPHQLNALGVSRTMQGVGLWKEMTVVENVMAPLHSASKGDIVSSLLGLPRSSRSERDLRERSLAALDRLGVAAYAGRLPGTLPYPIQKKVALARALVTEPRLLLLDEPASGLSEADIDELGGIVGSLRESCSVLLVEHRMDFVMGICDRIVVLDFGKVIASGTPSEVRADPAVMRAYLGEEVS